MDIVEWKGYFEFNSTLGNKDKGGIGTLTEVVSSNFLEGLR